MVKMCGYKIEPSELEGVHRICVLCWGLLGDVLLRVPVIEALAGRFPNAKITLVVDPVAVVVIQNHPACYEVLPFGRDKHPLIRYVPNFIRKIIYLRNKKFDLSVNLYSGGSSPLVTRLINARIRLGFDHTRALRKANNLLVKTPSFCGHWSRALGRTIEPLGIAASEIRRGSSFYCSERTRQFAHEFLGQAGQHYVAVNLGTRVPEKRWPVERYVKLAMQISDRYGLRPLVFSNPGMEELADQFVAEYAGSEPCKQVPVVSLDRVAALLEQVFAMITGDTSLMHLAFAVKCPTLVLFTHTRPELVEPEDCQHVACFIKDDHLLDECGLAYGIADIPVKYAQQRFDLLYAQIDNQSDCYHAKDPKSKA